MIPRNITHNFLVGNYGGSNGAIDKCVIATRDSGAPLRPFTCDAIVRPLVPPPHPLHSPPPCYPCCAPMTCHAPSDDGSELYNKYVLVGDPHDIIPLPT